MAELPGNEGDAEATGWTRLMNWFFGDASFRAGDWRGKLLLAGCFLAGMVHWVAFFDGGKLAYSAEDWPKEISYLRVWREALLDHRLPLYIDRQFQRTDCFLGIPETNLSPQVILLRWLEPGTFALVNLLILYAVGFAGSIRLGRQFSFSPFAFLTFFLLFHFNGSITAHLAVGHSMWGAYFLLPFFVSLIMEVGQGNSERAAIAQTALVLSAILYQGAFHFWIWSVMFLLLLGLANRSLRSFCGQTILLAGAIGAFRLGPAAVCLAARHERFFSGYPTLTDLLAGFTVLRTYQYPSMGGAFNVMGWWEYDMYVGLAGLLFLVYFGVRGLAGRNALPSHRVLVFPIAAMSMLAVTDVWALVTMLPIPFATVEKVSTRFVLLPFVFVLVVACSWAGKLLPAKSVEVKSGILVLLGVTSFELLQHSIRWMPYRLERELNLGHILAVMPTAAAMNVHLTTGVRPTYESMLMMSSIVSAIGLLLAFALWRWPRPSGPSAKGSGIC